MAKKNEWSDWSLALLRVVLGIIFLYHGYFKLFVPGGFTGTIGFFGAIGIPAPVFSALVVSVVEFVGGALLIFGLFTRWTSVVLFIEMLVAFFKVHWQQGFFIMPPAYGYEFALLILASLVVVAASGAGKWAVGSGFKNRHLQ